PPAHDLEALFDRGRSPRRFDTAHDSPQPAQCLGPSWAAQLDAGAARPRCFLLPFAQVRRCWQAHDEQGTVGGPYRLGQGLGEADVGIEAATAQAALRAGEQAANKSAKAPPGLVPLRSAPETRA